MCIRDRNNTIAMNINIRALTNSTISLDAILPPTTVEIDVGVINNLANSPVSRSPAIDAPIPIIQDIITVIPKTAGTKKSIYLIFPYILLIWSAISSLKLSNVCPIEFVTFAL